MLKKPFKSISILLCVLLCAQQSGFAQVAAELNIAGHLSSLHNAFTADKFRPLHLRYISYDNLSNNFKLLIDKGDIKNLQDQDIESTTKDLLNYFFVGISLPNDAFWVNLRPDSPDGIISPLLAQTDVGRILLESDLQLKKDTAKATSPETPEGRDYWNKLYQKAEELYGRQNVTIPTLTRPWIIPDEIIIREAEDSAYVYKATLKVMLEQDYLKGSSTYSFKDPREKELNEYSSQIIREKILPKLIKEVNSAKRYAPLRQVYYSLILSQWFKARNVNKNTKYSRLIDRKGLSNLQAKIPYSVDTYFTAYKENFERGEYNAQEPIYTSHGQVIRRYFSGGITNIAPVVPNLGQPTLVNSTGTMITVAPDVNDHSVNKNTLPLMEAVQGSNGELVLTTPLNQANSQMARTEENDFGIADNNQGGLNRQAHQNYHAQGRFAEVVEDIAKEIGAKKRTDGRYDLRGAVDNAPGRRIKTAFGEVYINEDGVLVIIDSRFQRNHAGRGEYAVYAVNSTKAAHEIAELKKWAEFATSAEAKSLGLSVSWEDIRAGRLGELLRGWMNEKGLSEQEKARRTALIEQKVNDFHQSGLDAERKAEVKLLQSLYNNSQAQRAWDGFMGAVRQRPANMKVLFAREIYKNEQRGMVRVLFEVMAPDGRHYFFIVTTEYGNIKSVIFSQDDVKGPLYECKSYFVVPDAFLEEIGGFLQGSGINVAAKIDTWVINRPWVETEEDRLAFEKAFESSPLIREFLFDLINRGINASLSGQYLITSKGAGAMYWRNVIYRMTYKVSNIPVFIHEFIHFLYDNLTSDEKKRVEVYFKQNHPELDLLFKTLLYRGKQITYATEGMAYYLQMALEGKLENSGWKTADGVEFSLKLRESDLDFFLSLGLISEGLRDNMLRQLNANQGISSPGQVLSQAKSQEEPEIDFIIASDNPGGSDLSEVLKDKKFQQTVGDVVQILALEGQEAGFIVHEDGKVSYVKEGQVVHTGGFNSGSMVSIPKRLAQVSTAPVLLDLHSHPVLLRENIVDVFPIPSEQDVKNWEESGAKFALIVWGDKRIGWYATLIDVSKTAYDEYKGWGNFDPQSIMVRLALEKNARFFRLNSTRGGLSYSRSRLEPGAESLALEEITIQYALHAYKEFKDNVAVVQSNSESRKQKWFQRAYDRYKDISDTALREEMRFPGLGILLSDYRRGINYNASMLSDWHNTATIKHEMSKEAKGVEALLKVMRERQNAGRADFSEEIEKAERLLNEYSQVLTTAEPSAVSLPQAGSNFDIAKEFIDNQSVLRIINDAHKAENEGNFEEALRNYNLLIEFAKGIADVVPEYKKLLQFAQEKITEIKSRQSDGRNNENANTGPGGIDFRFLPIVTQSVDSLKASIRGMSKSRIESINLTQEWSDIEHLIDSGITPSAERLKEYLAASYLKGNLGNDTDKIISSISDILRMQEEVCCSTEPMLKDILIVLGAGRSGEELKAAFSGVM